MQALDLNALTIGFARRFATYKRAGLILQDVERLTEMVSDSTGRSRSSSAARPTPRTAWARS